LLATHLEALYGQFEALIVCWYAEERNAWRFCGFDEATVWVKRNLSWFFVLCCIDGAYLVQFWCLIMLFKGA